MLGRARHAAVDWSPAVAILTMPEYERRIDALLQALGTATGLPDAYLYVPDASGRRLHLERARATSPHATTGAAGLAPGPVSAPDATTGAAGLAPTPVPSPDAPAADPLGSEQEGGAGWSAPTPPLEMPRGEDDGSDRVLDTPVGRMYAIALRDDAGELAGMVEVGPLQSGAHLRRLAARVDPVRFALAFALKHARQEESTRRELADATARLEAAQRLAGSAMDLDRFTQLLLDLALGSTRSEAGFVAIQRKAGEGLAVRAQSGMPAGFAEEVDLTPESGLFDWSPAADGGALVLADFDAAMRFGIRSLLAVPLLEGSRPLGIFALVNFGEGGTFDEHSLELCAAFADQIRLMLDNARAFGEFSDRYLETLESLARALDARSQLTHGHHERVAELAARLRLGEREQAAIRTAGLIHDVGLAGAAQVEGAADSDIEHPTVGASLVEQLPVHPQLVGAVAAHHEWYDGWGFPRGLAAEQIPIGGRILAMAEFIAEMSTDTPVRPGWDTERLTAEIGQRRGTQFDPAVADAAIELLNERNGARSDSSHQRR
jgi:putative nucleotidyltransferase with HDIG domain